MARSGDRRTRNWIEEQKQKNWILEQKRQAKVSMPEGYYSGDKPNPNMRGFVETQQRERPYDPATDDYKVQAFNKPIEATKATAIYNMHSYHQGKKPHDAIRVYIRHYTDVGDLVLDPFWGSGGTALAASLEGRNAIAIDRSPAATFITKNYVNPIDPIELATAFEELKHSMKPEIDWLYETECDRCGGKATTAFTVYSQVYKCTRCSNKVPVFDCVDAEGHTAGGKPKKVNACPHCYARGITEEISTRDERFGPIPVLISYLCEGSCKPVRSERRHNDQDPKKREYFERHDLAKLREIEEKEIPHWYPSHRMMHAPEDQECWGVKWRAGTSNFRTVDELFTKRNLWALGAIRDAAITIKNESIRDFTLAALTGSMLHLSRMSHHKEGGGGIMVGTYYIPQMFKERNALKNYFDKAQEIVKAEQILSSSVSGQVLISTQSSCVIPHLPSSCVDYIFTDPPYAETVQYGELNFVWESWLDLDTHWHQDEIIINEVRGKTEADWAIMMRQAMAECYRLLKPGRWLSLCYHDTSEGTWALIQDIMAEVGFVADKSDSALFIDTQQKSYNQLVADKVSKRDLVINFRKPRPGEVTRWIALSGNEDTSTFNDKVRMIIQEHLKAFPGASKDRIYDEVVSRMVRSGLMEAHNFDELLRQVAEPAGTPANGFEHWYLKEEEFAETDKAEAAKEDGAAEKIRTFISGHMKSHPGEEGVHYSDMFEHYLYTITDQPRRPLAEWLLDYFYKTDAGTYRLPASEDEERLKSDSRKKGTMRQIKRFIAFLEQGVAIPVRERQNDATLVEWIRHCQRTGLYEQGKLLYERGGINLDNLPQVLQASVDEDYQACARKLARGEPKASKRLSSKA